MARKKVESNTGPDPSERRARGLQPTAVFVQDRLRTIAEKRGFITSRIISAWPDVVGSSIAAISEPDSITFRNGAMLGKLRILTTGAYAAELQMLAPKIIERVNAAHGYNAIDKVEITQISAEKLAKGTEKKRTPIDHEERRRAREFAETATRDVVDPDLRRLLEELGAKIYSKST